MTDNFDSKKQSLYNVNDLLTIIKILRGENGCQWDKEQNHTTIRDNVIEEAYEVADAIDKQSQSELQEELGDLLLQVIFHCQIADEANDFTFEDVCNQICRKLIFRHPHVFGEVRADTSEQILANWDKLKLEEKSQDLYESLQSVPKSFPAILRSQKILKRAALIDNSLNNIEMSIDKSQINKEHLADKETFLKDIGPILLNLLNVARLYDVSVEHMLYNSSDELVTTLLGSQN